MTLEEAKNELSSGKGSLGCEDVKGILENLGFTLRRTKKGHYVYTHNGVPGFHSANFCCPHRSGNPVKKCYITNIINVLRQHESGLSAYLGATDD